MYIYIYKREIEECISKGLDLFNATRRLSCGVGPDHVAYMKRQNQHVIVGPLKERPPILTIMSHDI